MKAVIITGSRDLKYKHHDLILNILKGYGKGDIVIHGGCKTGADYIAHNLAERLGLNVIIMPAKWDIHGRAAGPKRNEEMMKVLLCLQNCGYEVCVEAFPLAHSKGTYNMIKIARLNNVPVEVHYNQ